jgi:hypothetical protein
MPINKKFRERVNCLLRLLKENRYPNHTIMINEMKKLDAAGTFKISRKTIQRDVAYLKEELRAPIDYDPVNRGYYLTNPYWEGYIPFLEEHEIDAAIIGAHLAETILPPSRLQEDIRKGTDALWSRNNGTADDFMVLSALVSNGSCAKVNPEIFQTVFEAWREQYLLHIKYLPINEDDYAVGEDILAVGTPLNLIFTHTYTKGIISAINRTIIRSYHITTALMKIISNIAI